MSKKTFVRNVGEYKELHRDEKTGIAWIEDGTLGCSHTCHPNIHHTGSVIGMKKLGYWRKDATVIRSHGWKFNVSRLSVDRDNEFELMAAKECRCVGCKIRRTVNWDRMQVIAKLLPSDQVTESRKGDLRRELRNLLETAPDGTLEELQSSHGLSLEEVTIA